MDTIAEQSTLAVATDFPCAAAPDLTRMLPKWARTDSPGISQTSPDFITEAASPFTGHYPTLPLPPAGAGAMALLAATLVAKMMVTILRQTRRRHEFR